MRLPITTIVAICSSTVLAALAAPVAAQTATGEEPSPWGVRVGVASDPDQVVAGVNFLETKVADNVYIVPHADIGFGDDAIVVSGTAGVHYRFEVDGSARPYAGGGLTVGWIDYDRPNNSSSDLEIGIRVTGGVIWRLKSGNEMFAELSLISGDLNDAQVMVGWRF